MISYTRTDFLYVFIPAMISLVACFLLIMSVAVQPPLRDRMYHRLSVALATTQIIMYIPRIVDRSENSRCLYMLCPFPHVLMYSLFHSLLMSLLYSRHTTSLVLCKIQDYLFQFGQCLTCVTITAINAYVFYVLYTTTLPDNTAFSYIFGGLIAICVVGISFSVGFDCAAMFCGNEDENTSLSYNDFDNGTRTQGIVFRSTYFYPLITLLFINVIFSFFCVFQMVYRVPENKFKLPLLKRLFTFTLIFIGCGFPKIVSMFLFDDIGAFANISDSIIHMSGVLLSGSYFYYAVVQDKKRWQTGSLLRETLLRKSSTPVEDMDSSSFSYRPSDSSMCTSKDRSSVASTNFSRSIDFQSSSSAYTAPRFTNDDENQLI